MESEDMTEEQILRLFEVEYIQTGYMYSGSIPANSSEFYGNKNNYNKLLELAKEGKIERRDCDGYSFELPKEKRRELIKAFGLAEKWEKKAPYFHPNDPDPAIGEVAAVLKQ